MTTEDAIALIYDLKRDRSSGHEKPHKPILLLAVLDLIESGAICDNKIVPSQELREAFTAYFKNPEWGHVVTFALRYLNISKQTN